MFFRSKEKKKKGFITLYQEDTILYEGPIEEIPLTDAIILETSIRFFNDPDPCYIHQGASRQRLVAELTKYLVEHPETPELSLFQQYTGLETITNLQIVWK